MNSKNEWIKWIITNIIIWSPILLSEKFIIPLLVFAFLSLMVATIEFFKLGDGLFFVQNKGEKNENKYI